MNTDYDDTLRTAFISHVTENLAVAGLNFVRLGPNQIFVTRGAADIWTAIIWKAPRLRVTSELCVMVTIPDNSYGMRGIDEETMLASWDLRDPNCTIENVIEKLVEVVDGHSA